MKRITAYCIAACLVMALAAPVRAAEILNFSVPPWPGVKVKTEIVTQLLGAMGYETVQRELSPPITYASMETGDIDVFLAGWVPQQRPMLDPKVEKGVVEVVQNNLDEAAISLCVPSYVYEQGVHKLSDLDKNADKFDSTIYNIEMGSGMYQAVDEMIEGDVVGLGDWKQVGSATPIMLSNAKAKAQDKEWVVFGCWKPHWMTLELDMKFLESGEPGTETLVSNSDVLTVVRKGFKDEYPNVYTMLKQFTVTSTMQSGWIHEYSYKKVAAEKVASDWISGNLDTVEKWLEGVDAADGKPAMDAVRSTFAK